MQGAAAIRTPRPEMNSHEKLEKALAHLSQTFKHAFNAGFYFENARPLEAGVSDNVWKRGRPLHEEGDEPC